LDLSHYTSLIITGLLIVVLGKYTDSSGSSCINNFNGCARRTNLFKSAFAVIRGITAVMLSQ
jgi:hypothetical protein